MPDSVDVDDGGGGVCGDARAAGAGGRWAAGGAPPEARRSPVGRWRAELNPFVRRLEPRFGKDNKSYLHNISKHCKTVCFITFDNASQGDQRL